MVTHLSMELAGSRMFARREIMIAPLARVLSFWFLAVSAVSTAIAFGLGLLLREDVLAGATTEMVLIASLTIPALFATQLAGQLLIVRGRLIAHGLASASGAVLQLALTLYLLATSNLTASTALATAALGFGSVGLLLIIALARDVGKGALLPRPAWPVLQKLVSLGARIHPATVALQLDPRLSLILVGALLTSSDAGVYSLALSLMGTVLLATQALSVSAVHTQYAEVETHATSFTLEFARQSFLLSLICASVMAAIAHPLILILYGNAFAEATVPFVILLLATVAVAIENPCRVLLTRVAHPLVVSGLVIGAITLNVAATIVLVQTLDIIGAAIATAVSYWVLTLLMLRMVSRRGRRSIREVLSPPHRDDEIVKLIRRPFRRAPS